MKELTKVKKKLLNKKDCVCSHVVIGTLRVVGTSDAKQKNMFF